MHLSFSSLILFAAVVVGQGISFTNPAYNGGTAAQNAIYKEGSRLDVTWTAGTNPTSTSLVLFQINATTGELLNPFEYLTQNVLNVTELQWTVFTSKDLSVSPLFVMNIFYTGATSPTAVSAQFNISSSAVAQTSTSSSSSSSSSSTSTTLSTSTTSSSSSTTTSAGPTTSAASSSGGLATGAKVGIGIAVPVVALLGVAAGYFFFRNRNNKKNAGISGPPTVQDQPPYDPNKATAYTPMVMSEVSGDSAHPQPYEMNPHQPAHPQAYEIYTPEHHGR